MSLLPYTSTQLGCSLVIGAALTLLVSTRGHAEPILRKQVDQRGDFLLFGNTLGWDCDRDVAEVLAGQVDCSGVTNTTDTAIDVYWRADAPIGGKAVATNATAMADARSTAMLTLPVGAKVTYARLYWAAYQTADGLADTTVTMEPPNGGSAVGVTADATYTGFVTGTTGEFWYESTADVTSLLTAGGQGAYRISGVSSVDGLASLNNQSTMAGWAVVVFYEAPTDPPRNLALFDGLDAVNAQSSRTVTLNGFLVPTSGYTARLGVLAYEGDAPSTGDQLLFNGTALSDAANPLDNFFNSTRSLLGSGVHFEGDLPQLSGLAGSMGGMDLDVVDVTELVHAGDSSAAIEASTTSDRFALGAFVTSITTFKPDFSSTQKSVTDINGGALRPLDQLQYEIVVINHGNDSSVQTVLTDKLPTAVSYVPGSIEILTPAVASLTDAKGDDAGEFDATTGTVTVRLGTLASATQGGSLAPNAAVTVRFKVALNANASGTIDNQAAITAGGLLGAPTGTYPTDGNGTGIGAPPTSIAVTLGCLADSDCATPNAYCAPGTAPRACVACLTDSHCKAPQTPNCIATTHSCACGAGVGLCSDSDRDGLSDGLELAAGTDPNDADSDDDGVLDGSEPSWNQDTDGDSLINGRDPDSDGDGLFDGTELGLDCAGAQTDLSRKMCTADADRGQTVTNPLLADTDGGGMLDGREDLNKNGAVDLGERDPKLATDDTQACVSDSECGVIDSGQVCGLSNACISGCRAVNGNHCPPGQSCSSEDTNVGNCSTLGMAGAAGAAGAANVPETGGTVAIAGAAGATTAMATGGVLAVAGASTVITTGGASTGGAPLGGSVGKAGARATVAGQTARVDPSLLYGTGCGCRVASPNRMSGIGLGLVGLLVAAARRRRAQTTRNLSG